MRKLNRTEGECLFKDNTISVEELDLNFSFWFQILRSFLYIPPSRFVNEDHGDLSGKLWANISGHYPCIPGPAEVVCKVISELNGKLSDLTF